MEEIFTQIVGLSAGLIIFYTIITILLHWLFLRSAIKSGVEAAILNIMEHTEIYEEIKQKKLNEEFQEEMDNWN